MQGSTNGVRRIVGMSWLGGGLLLSLPALAASGQGGGNNIGGESGETSYDSKHDRSNGSLF